MKQPFSKGDTKTFTRKVTSSDFAAFDTGGVHAVLSTFAITRDAEWAGRLFVLDMKEPHEEGIGTFVELRHKAPAFENEEVCFTSVFEEITPQGEIVTSFTAAVGNRIIANGRTGQRILSKDFITEKFLAFKNNHE